MGLRLLSLVLSALCLVVLVGAQIDNVLVSISPRFRQTQGGDTSQHKYCQGVECVDEGWSLCLCSDQGVLNKCNCRPNCNTPLDCTSTGAGEAQARWGRPVYEHSGLGFSSGVPPDSSVQLDTEFYLGKLTHFNFPVYDAAASTQMVLSFTVKTPSQEIVANNVPFNFPLFIDETPNSYPCAYPSQPDNPCSDRIGFGALANQSFVVNEVSYTVILTGFKETPNSLSFPVDEFISDEKDARHAFLFAKITAACPPVCIGGGEFIIRDDSTCGCDCSSLPSCPSPKIFAPNCECICPDLDQCDNGNGGTLLPDCTCECNPCDGVQILNPLDCSCSCPALHCNSGTLADPNDPNCPCDCTPPPNCGPNEEISSTCLCNCPDTDETCAAINPLMIENPSNDICACICDPQITCGANFFLDPTTCECQCREDACPNGYTLDDCICGNCSEFWEKDADGYCTNCVRDCLETEVLDTDRCVCLCENLDCNLEDDGLVVALPDTCGCRNCTAGECFCGNGKVEPGEQCDVGAVYDPCCVNCQFTFGSCDDKNGCTAPDRCNGQGNCTSTYKCAPSTACMNITCEPSVGDCVSTHILDGSFCGNGNLCSNRCENGLCSTTPVTCPVDPNPLDCWVYQCQPGNGSCVFVQRPDNSPCSDGDLCTLNDVCVGGVCAGTPRVCTTTNECQAAYCSLGSCETLNLSGKFCNYDGDNCTHDQCSNGQCIQMSLTSCTHLDSLDKCTVGTCNKQNGECFASLKDGTVCSDGDPCTHQDQCVLGACVGVPDPDKKDLEICGGTPPTDDKTAPIAYAFAAAGAAALIGLIIGLAFLIKRIKNSKLMDPDTWNPDTFSTIGANPMYKASEMVVDNKLYEAS